MTKFLVLSLVASLTLVSCTMPGSSPAPEATTPVAAPEAVAPVAAPEATVTETPATPVEVTPEATVTEAPVAAPVEATTPAAAPDAMVPATPAE